MPPPAAKVAGTAPPKRFTLFPDGEADVGVLPFANRGGAAKDADDDDAIDLLVKRQVNPMASLFALNRESSLRNESEVPRVSHYVFFFIRHFSGALEKWRLQLG